MWWDSLTDQAETPRRFCRPVCTPTVLRDPFVCRWVERECMSVGALWFDRRSFARLGPTALFEVGFFLGSADLLTWLDFGCCQLSGNTTLQHDTESRLSTRPKTAMEHCLSNLESAGRCYSLSQMKVNKEMKPGSKILG